MICEFKKSNDSTPVFVNASQVRLLERGTKDGFTTIRFAPGFDVVVEEKIEDVARELKRALTVHTPGT